MSVTESPFAPTSPEVENAPLVGWWKRFDDRLEWLSDSISSLVVKEARQAMKSKQFTLTFALLLVCGGCWTALGVALQMPAVLHSPSGPSLVAGYYVILAVPLLVIVPFSSFRSLASEREDGTFELLSITTLSARQIILGKLAGAVLQMLLYYSALAPCIAFTYLLRGLDIITIALFLVYLFLASVLLSAFSLAVATLSRARHWQVLLSVVLVGGLMFVLWMWLWASFETFDNFLYNPPYDQPTFWTVNVAICMFHAVITTLFVLIAAGQISFASNNRSTPIRWTLFTLHVLWFGWMFYAYQISFDDDIPFIALMFALVVWSVAGALFCGERAELSPRVRRELPQSYFGRMMLTWLNPGSGTGYIFTVLNLGTFFAMFGLLAMLDVRNSGRPVNMDRITAFLFFSATSLAYVASYLGVGRLLVLALSKRTVDTVPLSLMLQFVLVAFGTLIPLVVQFSVTTGFYSSNYTLMQITNPFWTCAELMFNRSNLTMTVGDSPLFAAIIVWLFGGGMFFFQFLLAVREVAQTRTAAPQRVMEEDAALLGLHATPKRKSPWDDEEFASSSKPQSE